MTQESKGNLCFLVVGACLPGALVIRSDDLILVKALLLLYILTTTSTHHVVVG